MSMLTIALLPDTSESSFDVRAGSGWSRDDWNALPQQLRLRIVRVFTFSKR